jgi:hypothetical protein
MAWRSPLRIRALVALVALAGAITLPSGAIEPPQSSCNVSGGCLLREGSPVPLEFAADLSSRTANRGDEVEFLLADDLKVADSIVAQKGSRAVGTVASVKRAGTMEKPGELTVRLEYLIAGSDRVRIRGTEQRGGNSEM